MKTTSKKAVSKKAKPVIAPVGSYAASTGKSAVFLVVNDEVWNSTGIRSRLRSEIREQLGKDTPVVILPYFVSYDVRNI